MDRAQQINVRLSDEEVSKLDEKRVELKESLGRIPSRGEVVRLALDAFLAKPARRDKR